MKKLIAVAATVALTVGIGSATASAADPAVNVEFSDTAPGTTTANVEVTGEHTIEVVKHNPRTDRGRVVDSRVVESGAYQVPVNFPKAKRWHQVRVVVDGVPVAFRMVEMPRDQWPTVKPRPWSSVSTWFRHADVWVHADQPRGTAQTKRGKFYRVQVVRGDRVRTVQKGRVSAGDRDRARLKFKLRHKGAKYVTVRVKSGGKVIGQRRAQVRW